MPIGFIASNSSMITCGSNSTLNNQEPFILSGWVRPDTLGIGSLGIIACKRLAFTSSGQWTFQVVTNNCLYFVKDYSTTDLQYCTTNNVFTLRTPFHFILAWNGSNGTGGIKIYVNGISVNTTAAATVHGVGTKQVDTFQSFNIGGSRNLFAAFSGLISTVGFWGSATIDTITIDNLSKSKIAYAPLQFTPSTGGLRAFWPLNDFPESFSIPNSSNVMDKSLNSNTGSVNLTPIAYADQINTYS